MFFSILNRKINSKPDSSQCSYAKQNIKPFHLYSSLSKGVTKYAAIVNITNINPRLKLRKEETYFKYITKRRQNESCNA
jgi:hypothetical protein